MTSKIKLLIAMLFISITTMAQSPNIINYQGVARDTSGNPIANQQIRLRFKIRDNTSNGTIEFTEVRKVTTSASGLFNCQIGGTGAISQSTSLLALPWNDGNKFLQVEMDVTGGIAYTNLGAQQLASVPYALHTKKADALTLPYDGVDSTLATSFSITNNHSNLSAIAMQGIANGGIGVYGKSNTKQGVYGASYSSTYSGVFGFNYSQTGTGVQGRSQQGIGVHGETVGSGIGVKGSSAGIYSIGVLGENTTGVGVKGSATNAGSSGVWGQNTIGYGVYGSTTSGTALRGYSTSGYGLELVGNVKIEGGNTNPGMGKVLTSDASGNATWEGAVAFSVKIPVSPTIATNTSTSVSFNNELYDLANNFNTSTYRFTAPVNGIYHFDCQIGWQSALSATFTGEVSLQRINGGNTYNLGSNLEKIVSDIKGYSSLSKDVTLQAGDVVYVQVYQSSGSNKSLFGDTYFNGRLVVKL